MHHGNLSVRQMLLSATNSSRSAYCSVTIRRECFAKYTVVEDESYEPERSERWLRTRLKAKLLLGYLRVHRKSKTLCTAGFSIINPSFLNNAKAGAQWMSDEDEDEDEDEKNRECRLLLKFTCDKNVRKVTRLVLEEPGIFEAPRHDTIDPPRTIVMTAFSVQAIMGHLRHASTAADGQVTCEFRTEAMFLEAVGLPVADLLEYNPPPSTFVMSFHIREFAAFIELALAVQLPIKITYYNTSKPLIMTLVPDVKDPNSLPFAIECWIATGNRPAPPKPSILKRPAAFGAPLDFSESHRSRKLFRS
ncbi:hypothetical protein CALVIDRAFT_528838 [Calocera viscosa TUFC12733]|uniref:Rad9-domain-containing protein n=1 Tax=Calocera viscosa (strain TUFC12733) TaxID=1330018 RepID=A0A167K7C1_CALVF|nr:hypothetical protein CALVIDRAFT_528838 [Calocera viscosa TUFC12733]